MSNAENSCASSHTVLESIEESEPPVNEAPEEHIRKPSSPDVSNSITLRRNPLRTCRTAHSVDYTKDLPEAPLHTDSDVANLYNICKAYEQLPHAQFPHTFVSFAKSALVELAGTGSDDDWEYPPISPASEVCSYSEDSISIPSSPDSCQLFGLRVRTRSPSVTSISSSIEDSQSTTPSSPSV